MASAITARLQTPADASGNRDEIHLINTEEEVYVGIENENNGRTLKHKLQEMRPVISRTQPQISQGFKSSYLWGRIVYTDDIPDMSTIEQNLHTEGRTVNTNITAN